MQCVAIVVYLTSVFKLHLISFAINVYSTKNGKVGRHISKRTPFKTLISDFDCGLNKVKSPIYVCKINSSRDANSGTLKEVTL